MRHRWRIRKGSKLKSITKFTTNDTGKISATWIDDDGKPYPFVGYDRAAPEFYAALEALVLPALISAGIPQAETCVDGANIVSLSRTYPKSGHSRIKGYIRRLLDDSDADALSGVVIPNRPVVGKLGHSEEFMDAYRAFMSELDDYIDGKRAQMEIAE